MTRLDPRAPLVIDTRDVGHRPGAMVEMHRTVEAPPDLGTDVIRIAAGEPIELDLRLESVVEGVLVTGEVQANAVGSCVRCLESVTLSVDARFQELFAWPNRAEHHREVGADDDAEPYRMEGDLIDLEPVLRDTVVPALPFQPVCREECQGLCSECGVVLTDHPEHQHEQIDPRWSALATLAGPTATNEKRN
ncbi:MAG: YceD family protein [Nostocoides sp.]